MNFKLLFICLLALNIDIVAAKLITPTPPQLPLVWITSGSVFDISNNWTASAQVFYDWRRPAQVVNLMRNDSYSYTIFHVERTVWRLQRSNQTCCIDPQHTGITPPRPDWLQIGNQTTYDGIISVMEHACQSWTKSVPDFGAFSWLTSVTTGVPCRLGWLRDVHFDFAFFSDNPNLLPKGIFDIPSYCPSVVTDPNCDVFHF